MEEDGLIHLELYSGGALGATSAGELDLLARQLSAAIAESGAGSATIVDRASLPQGAKVAQFGLAGALAIQVVPLLVSPLMQMLVDWIRDHRNQKLNIHMRRGNEVVTLNPGMTSREMVEAVQRVDTIVAGSAPGAKKSALLIGNAEYQDALLTRLKAPGADTQALAAILEDPEIGGFDRVTVLLNKTASEVKTEIERFYQNRTREELLLMYFSGHGLREEGGEFYLAARDTSPSVIRSTGISADFIRAVMDRSFSKRQVLILDCCYSGAFVRGSKGARAMGASLQSASAFQGSGYGQVVLTASDRMQYAWEGNKVIDQSRHSLFTHYLIEGLSTGKADENNDGRVSLNELYSYVFERVRQNQTPSISTNQRGEIIIAANPHPVVRPKALPRDLQDAIDSPHRLHKRGAIVDLERLLYSGDPGMALAAQQALGCLGQDDSREISEAANRVLQNDDRTRTVQPAPGPIPPKRRPVDPRPPSGTPLPAPLPEPQQAVSSSLSCLFYVLALVVPVAGIVLFAVYRSKPFESDKKMAKTLLVLSLVSLGLTIMLSCLGYLVSA